MELRKGDFMYDKAKFIPAGDVSLVMEFGNSISPIINSKIRNMANILSQSPLKGLIEIIPTYRSISIIYNPIETAYDELVNNLKELENSIGEAAESEIRIVELPTVYGGEYGPDIEFVAKHNDLTVDQVINIHTSRDYLLYMLGFTPVH